LAEFVVQISLYEGFGYPVAEAMASGAAVIAAAATSIPEIAGSNAILVPPLDSSQLTRHMLRLAGDPDAREALKTGALKRAAQFANATELGTVTVSSYRKALGTASKPRPTIAIWSSMPPLDCGVA
jgi:glycosyltransferase involved in cell wall biosynthesis